jgi:hypothetical protein
MNEFLGVTKRFPQIRQGECSDFAEFHINKSCLLHDGWQKTNQRRVERKRLLCVLAPLREVLPASPRETLFPLLLPFEDIVEELPDLAFFLRGGVFHYLLLKPYTILLFIFCGSPEYPANPFFPVSIAIRI